MVAACREGGGTSSADPGPAAPSARAAALDGSPVGTSSAASNAPPAPKTPCDGKPAGARACAANDVVECDGSGQQKLVQSCLDIERCDGAKATCEPACGAGEVYIPATPKEGFRMGRGKVGFGFGSRKSGVGANGVSDTPHTVVLTRPFCMDAHEITVADYARCVEAGKCTLPDTNTFWRVYPHKPDMPANMIHWRQSMTYCAFEGGKTLPTEAQWEWAATGPEGTEFPWGNEQPTCEHADFTPGALPDPACDCGCHKGGASPVGTHPKGDKSWPTGKLHDLGGNVWEWTLDNYWRFDTLPATDPLYLVNQDQPHVLRGGGWNRSAPALGTSYRAAHIVGYQRPAIGARCIRNPGGTTFEMHPKRVGQPAVRKPPPALEPPPARRGA